MPRDPESVSLDGLRYHGPARTKWAAGRPCHASAASRAGSHRRICCPLAMRLCITVWRQLNRIGLKFKSVRRAAILAP
jgi:hypothetical protein